MMRGVSNMDVFKSDRSLERKFKKYFTQLDWQRQNEILANLEKIFKRQIEAD